METSKQLLSFVIPCYHSEKMIAEVTERIIRTVNNDGRYDYEIICVNDASTDHTLDILHEIAEKNDRITVVDLMRNFGQHSALMCGFNYVSGDIIVCLDDDGQTPPEEMFRLIDKLDEGYDMVSARYPRKKESPFRLFGAWTAEKVAEFLLNKPKNVDMNSFFAAKSIVIKEIVKYPNPYPNVQGLILRVTKNITDTEINHQSRIYGKSGYTLSKLVGLWMNSFTSFSEKPLRFSSAIGIFTAIAGFVMGIYTIVRKLIHPDVVLGYSSIMAVILILFGITLMMLGLLGEYIGRMFICINRAPQYAVRSVKNDHTKKNHHDK